MCNSPLPNSPRPMFWVPRDRPRLLLKGRGRDFRKGTSPRDRRFNADGTEGIGGWRITTGSRSFERARVRLRDGIRLAIGGREALLMNRSRSPRQSAFRIRKSGRGTATLLIPTDDDACRSMSLSWADRCLRAKQVTGDAVHSAVETSAAVLDFHSTALIPCDLA